MPARMRAKTSRTEDAHLVSIGDVRELERQLKMDMTVWGVEADFRRENHDLIVAIGQAIVAEFGISSKAAQCLPDEIVLPPSAHAAFERWREFLLRRAVSASTLGEYA